MVKNKKLSVFTIILLVLAFVLTSAILSINGQIANAYTTGNIPNSIGSLTYSDYATRTDGMIFNNTVLEILFGKITGQTTDTYKNALSTVKGSTSTQVGYATGSDKDNIQPYTMDYSMINGGNTITVEFGGYKWDVVYLTTNTVGNTDGDGDLIATLWMSESQGATVWSPMTSATTTYAASNYGTSQVRIEALNAGSSDYVSTTYPINTSGAANTVSADARVDNQFAKFTLSNAALDGTSKANTSLIEYIATPSQVLYQRTENCLWGFNKNGGWSMNIFANEAWGDGTDGVTGPKESMINGTSNTGGWTNDNIKALKSTPGYYDWKDDYLWLPSTTEVGWANSTTYESNTSYSLSWWGIPNKTEILYSTGTNPTAMRTATNTTAATKTNPLTPHGGLLGTDTTATFLVRPAIHLNLTAVVELEVPDAIELVYDGNKKEVEDLDWFTGVYESSLEDPTYYKLGSSTPLKEAPTAAGDYEVALTIKDTVSKIWNDGDTSNQTRRIKFTIKKQPVDIPSFDETSLVYKGGGPVIFYLDGFDDTIMKDISIPSTYKGVSFSNTGDPYISATKAGKYEFDVELKDTDNYAWSTKIKKLEIEVEKAPINVTVDDGSLNYVLSGKQGTTITAYLEVDASHKIHINNTATANIMAYRAGAKKGTKIGDIDLTNSSGREQITMDLNELRADTQYIIKVEFDDTKDNEGANYEAIMTEETVLNVTDPSVQNSVTWKLTADGKIVANRIAYSEIGEYTQTFSAISYDGKKYGFDITVPTGYTIDPSYGTNGDVYIITAKNLSSSSSDFCISHDEYTISIRLIDDTTSETQVYTLEWEIVKAKFDLSKTVWLYDGNLPYTPGGIAANIDNSTVPKGLNAIVNTTDGQNVGDSGTAYVSFSFEDATYEENYELPDSDIPTSYIFTPSDGRSAFEWSKNWKVVAAPIQLKWVSHTY
ncbi:MAG: hypothetical protein NC179_06010, partial [[Eubacterium] siraeum]|nr:hypothetical protein [[Eubacterium] siraeum]